MFPTSITSSFKIPLGVRFATVSPQWPKSRFINPKEATMPNLPFNLISTRESLDILRLSSLDGAIRHLKRAGLKPIRRGHALLWDRAAVLDLVNSQGVSHA